MFQTLINLIGLFFKYHFYFAICYIAVCFMRLNLGIHKLAIDCLGKLFNYIQQNECKFFTKKPKIIITDADTDVDDVKSSSETIKINGYTKQEIDECFSEKEPDQWNLLKSTWKPINSTFEYKLNQLGLLVFYCGLIVRVLLLFPHRLIIFFMVIITVYGGQMLIDFLMIFFPNSWWVSVLQKYLVIAGWSMIGMSLHIYVNHHRDQDSAVCKGGIAVSNHTGPPDVPVLHDNLNYGFLFRTRKGFLCSPGYKALEQTRNFIRTDPDDDQELVKQRIIDRASNQNLDPLVIFVEGTCTAVDIITRFKKGIFELGFPIYPIAIKYNPLYCSPFWNSRSKSLLSYFLQNFLHWSTVADVYYLSPVNRQESESAIEFSQRVQSLIADRAGFKQVNIDGLAAKNGKLYNN